MDKHIEVSYCCFEAFEVLAKNYLVIEFHELYGEIKRLLGETKKTPADVGENLLVKSEDEDAETCVKLLVGALEEAKEESKRVVNEEGKQKAEEEEEKIKTAEEKGKRKIL